MNWWQILRSMIATVGTPVTLDCMFKLKLGSICYWYQLLYPTCPVRNPYWPFSCLFCKQWMWEGFTYFYLSGVSSQMEELIIYLYLKKRRREKRKKKRERRKKRRRERRKERRREGKEWAKKHQGQQIIRLVSMSWMLQLMVLATLYMNISWLWF